MEKTLSAIAMTIGSWTLMHRGDVWLVNLDRTVGTEINKTRPAIILNDDAMGILPSLVLGLQ